MGRAQQEAGGKAGHGPHHQLSSAAGSLEVVVCLQAGSLPPPSPLHPPPPILHMGLRLGVPFPSVSASKHFVEHRKLELPAGQEKGPQ